MTNKSGRGTQVALGNRRAKIAEEANQLRELGGLDGFARVQWSGAAAGGLEAFAMDRLGPSLQTALKKAENRQLPLAAWSSVGVEALGVLERLHEQAQLLHLSRLADATLQRRVTHDDERPGLEVRSRRRAPSCAQALLDHSFRELLPRELSHAATGLHHSAEGARCLSDALRILALKREGNETLLRHAIKVRAQRPSVMASLR